jgi:hypothetical protein
MGFARAPLASGETVAGACARLLGAGLVVPATIILRCGAADASTWQGPGAVRTWLTERPRLLANADFLDPQIWFDENVRPMHAHVVVDLVAGARVRYEAFVRAHPKVRIATVVDGIVENVADGASLGENGRFFITPSVPPGSSSNEPVASALGARMGAAPLR